MLLSGIPHLIYCVREVGGGVSLSDVCFVPGSTGRSFTLLDKYCIFIHNDMVIGMLN